MFFAVVVRAVDITFGAAGADAGTVVWAGFATSDGTDLGTGSLVRIGTFNLSNAQITANASNLSVLNSSWIALGDVYIGDGDPNSGVNEGLFFGSISAVNTTAQGINPGATLFYWVYNASTVNAATQQGLFSSTTWLIPSGDGGGLDFSTLDTDLNNLTVGGAGSTLDNSIAFIAIGSAGLGTNAAQGGMDFQLAAIPEPAHIAGWGGLLMLGFAFVRRRFRAG